jgi:hypothetical protein
MDGLPRVGQGRMCAKVDVLGALFPDPVDPFPQFSSDFCLSLPLSFSA